MSETNKVAEATGPWTLGPCHYGKDGETHRTITDGIGGRVATVSHRSDQPTKGLQIGKLVAAAPGLLAALESIDLRLTQARIASEIGKKKDADRVEFLRGQLEEIRKDARAAIAKVEGRPA